MEPSVSIIAGRRNGTLYTGVASDLIERAWPHRKGHSPGFTRRCGCKLPVCYEQQGTMESAILREKQPNGGSPRKKLELIEAMNPVWQDPFEQLFRSGMDCFVAPLLAMTAKS